jgi:hypothetical protein
MEHKRPVVCRVPVQFAKVATGEPHVDAGNVF